MNAFASAFRDKRVFVSGHTGFKGAWLCEWLLQLGADVTGYSLPPQTEPALFNQLGLARRVRHLTGDIRDAKVFRSAIHDARPDFFFHLAAQSLVRESYAHPTGTFETNTLGTAYALEALRDLKKPCAAVFITTDKCYQNREWIYGYREEDPLGGRDPYSASKAAAEIVIHSYRQSFFANHPVKIASARAGNVIGGGDWAVDRIVPDCIRALQQKRRIPIRNPQATRPWQHVLEPLSGYLWLAARLSQPSTAPRLSSGIHPQLSTAFNFGPATEANRTVGELVEEILKHWPGRWEDRRDPKAVHEAGLLQLSTDKAHALLRWSPVWKFTENVEQTVKWYRQTQRTTAAATERELTVAQIEQYVARARQLALPWASAPPSR